jgi:hypothetical protein
MDLGIVLGSAARHRQNGSPRGLKKRSARQIAAAASECASLPDFRIDAALGAQLTVELRRLELVPTADEPVEIVVKPVRPKLRQVEGGLQPARDFSPAATLRG